MNAITSSIRDFGADPSGNTLCTDAFEQAVSQCRKQGGGTVYVPPGVYLTSPIEFIDDMTLHVDAGAEIRFIDDPEQVKTLTSRWEGNVEETYMPLLYGKGLKNISLTGRGTLNGQGQKWWSLFKGKKLAYARPRFICFEDCERILIEGVRLIDSPSWTVNPVNSRNITIHDISIRNPADSPNTDGINPDSCSDVRISDCHVDVGDDCITIKSGVEYNPDRIPCRNISITNCTMVHGHGGVVIGSEMSGGIRNVVISNCILDGTDRGIRIKSRRGRGGVVEDIRVNNVIMNDVMCPIVMNLYYFCGQGGKEKKVWDPEAYPFDATTPVFRRISLTGITAGNARAAAFFLYGLPESPIEDITFNDVRVQMSEKGEPDYPAMMSRLEPMKQQGGFGAYLKNVTFRDVKIENQQGEAVRIENAKGITGLEEKRTPGEGLDK